MKITKQQLINIIKEEVEQLTNEAGRFAEDSYEDTDTSETIRDAAVDRLVLGHGIGSDLSNRLDMIDRDDAEDRQAIYVGLMKAADAARRFVDQGFDGPSIVEEDGHTDVPSAVRKLKTSMEDAMEILNALEGMPEAPLPSWWMSKITLAADYLNKSRDYLLVSEDKEYVKSFYTAKEKRADHLIDKGVDPDIAYGVADDQMAKAGKKIKRKKK
tara:strand:- start:635 stop:1276 length:642 start_codon:yes stop_codon:yes gene_type:complete